MTAPKTILIIEDEKSVRNALADVLRAKKFMILEAKNGKEGIEMALSKHPDLILLDLIMPEMDGMTAFKKIREDVWGSCVPVIILTNLSATNEDLIEDVVKCKPVHYFVKSDWKIHNVIKEVEKILAKK